jgi:hypothetical protein
MLSLNRPARSISPHPDPTIQGVAGWLGNRVRIACSVMTASWTLVHNSDYGRGALAKGHSPATLGHRHAEAGHLVQHRAGDLGLGLLGRQGPGAAAAANDSPVAERRRFRVRTPAAGDRLLPAQTSFDWEHLDMLVVLAGCGCVTRTRHRGWAWRDEHRDEWVGLSLCHGPQFAPSQTLHRT